MRRLIVSEFVTLDGVMEAPGHDEHRDGKNAWALSHAGEDQQRYKIDEVMMAGGLLMGRVTYEIFAAFWPTAPRDEGFADRMNSIPKYVVSGSLRTTAWQNTTIIGGNPVEAITELKGQPGGDIMHTGEIELRADDDVGGIGVHIAARALAHANDRQVVVTRTVRDLATGTDLAFAPLGAVGLRGIPGEWELFAVSAGGDAGR
jgi:dihydrofolate reductase